MVKKILCVAGLAFALSNLWGAAKWISADDFSADAPNTWVAFRKDVKLDSVPKSVKVKIGADSKYWLWINGELAVFEGGLKRGPNPTDTYYDEIDIAKYAVTSLFVMSPSASSFSPTPIRRLSSDRSMSVRI